jgi:hypothetical protein
MILLNKWKERFKINLHVRTNKNPKKMKIKAAIVSTHAHLRI